MLLGLLGEAGRIEWNLTSHTPIETTTTTTSTITNIHHSASFQADKCALEAADFRPPRSTSHPRPDHPLIPPSLSFIPLSLVNQHESPLEEAPFGYLHAGIPTCAQTSPTLDMPHRLRVAASPRPAGVAPLVPRSQRRGNS